MRNIIIAIARLLGLQTRQDKATVELTQTAGPVLQEPIILAGKASSVETTKSQSPAQPRTQKKPKAAQSTTAASKNTSKKQQPAQTEKSRKADGSSSQTPASKTRQHAKRKVKAKR